MTLETLEHILQPIRDHDRVHLRNVEARLLKQTDGEGWAVGQMLERALDFLDPGDQALRGYLGQTCKLCGEVFETQEDLNTAIWVGKAGHPAIAHQACYDTFWTKEQRPPDERRHEEPNQ